MLDAVLIGPSPDLSSQIQCLCTTSTGIFVYRSLPRYGGRYEIVRLLNLLSPQILLLEVDSSLEAVRIAKEVRAASPKIPIVGFGRDCDSELIVYLKEAGVDSLLLWPFTENKLKQAIAEALEGSKATASGRLFIFLPAKAGSGASTAALNLGGALARNHRQKVLLIDADMHSGVQALHTGSSPANSVADAPENAQQLAPESWSSMVVRTNGLDLLAAPTNPRSILRLFSPWDYLHLLAFVRARYDSVLVDLPEVVNEATEAIAKQADNILVVCTPELASLALARRRISELLFCEIEEFRLRVVLNRHTDRGLKRKEIERILGRQESVSLPNDYLRVCRAGLEGTLLAGNSKIGRAFAEFADKVAEVPGTDVRAAERMSINLSWCRDGI